MESGIIVVAVVEVIYNVVVANVLVVSGAFAVLLVLVLDVIGVVVVVKVKHNTVVIVIVYQGLVHQGFLYHREDVDAKQTSAICIICSTYNKRVEQRKCSKVDFLFQLKFELKLLSFEINSYICIGFYLNRWTVRCVEFVIVVFVLLFSFYEVNYLFC